MLAQDGRCKTLDASADGYVRSETSIVVLMTILSVSDDALGEFCEVFLCGSFVNQVFNS